ncbi:MAG: alpha/beta hydrolase [Pseudomonadota bacterium]|jgi:acetyl esterase/lipase
MLDNDLVQRLPETVEFKRCGDILLYLDRYRAPNTARGCVAFLHGGALLLGGRSDLPEAVVELLLRNNFDIVSLDYRVLSEASLDEIHGDVRDGCRFVRDLYPSLPLILAGYSAGAYLALAGGVGDRLVDGICAFAGYGDLSACWYREPSEFFRKYKDVSYVAQRLAQGSPFLSLDERIDLYIYLRQTGTWPQYALDGQFSESRLRELSPLHNLGRRYPPTVLIHGTNDCDVPYSASQDMALALNEADILHRLILMPEMDHDLFAKVELPEARKAWIDALEWLLHLYHLKHT